VEEPPNPKAARAAILPDNHFWSRGYCVSTVGLDEKKIRRYVKYQEENERLAEDQRQEFGLF